MPRQGPLRVALLYNRPTLDPFHADAASEAGVIESVDAFLDALRGAGHEARPLALGAGVAEAIDGLESPWRPDAVVNLCEGFGGSSAHEPNVAALLELLGVPYTGSPPECLGLVRHKARTEWLLRGKGLLTPASWLVAEGESAALDPCRAALSRGPLIVKPAAEDASLGISQDSVVTSAAALERQVRVIGERYGPVLVEQFIDGRELNLAVLALGEPVLLPISEIDFGAGRQRWRLVTYDAKWTESSAEYAATPTRCPAEVEPELATRLAEVALEAFRAVGARDYGRVDVRVDTEGRVYILEVNANPDLSPRAGFARALKARGMTYESFAVDLVTHAVRRGAAPAAPAARPDAASSARAEKDRATGVTLGGLDPSDVPGLVEILRACGNFRPDEVDVGTEVLEEAAAAGPDSHYHVVVARCGGELAGWAAYGLVPLTDASYDLYWIAVHPRFQRHGAGRILLREVEDRVARRGGRWLVAETSSTALYSGTRAFYLRNGYAVLGTIGDFYRDGDARTTYGRRLDADRQDPSPERPPPGRL